MKKILNYIYLINDFKKKYGYVKLIFFIMFIFLILIFSIFVFVQVFIPFTYIAI